mgnify:CR=1 FL=1
MNGLHLRTALKAEAWRLGFDHCRILPIGPAAHADFFDDWLAAGNHAGMGYLTRHADKRRDPARLADAKSGPLRTLIVLAVDYRQGELPAVLRDDPSRGIIASYAWGDDYHELIRPALYALDRFLAGLSGRTSRGKALVDTGPVLERDWAQQAGIGFTGKNCCTIRPRAGSSLFLATLLVPEALPYDPVPMRPPEPDARAVLDGLPWAGDYGRWEIPLTDGSRAMGTCARCTRCLTACPTDAFVGPFHLDARRCISYWTIETQAPIPVAWRPAFGNRIFGCDICQEVCPWNARLPARTPRLTGLAARPECMAPPLVEGFAPETPYWRDEEAFARRFAASPVLRATRTGMARSVCVALGNWAAAAAVDPLLLALADPAAVVRGHAAWGLGQCLRRGVLVEQVRAALQSALASEQEPEAAAEMAAALA